MNNQVNDSIKEIMSIIVIAFILSMALRTWVIEGRIVPTGSMLPTIQLQDRLMVNKLIYHFRDPRRGEVVVFRPPDALHAKDDYVKRVVGLPGDKIEIRNGQLYIDDQTQDEPYIAESMEYNFGPVVVPKNSYFMMGDNRNHSFDSHQWGVWLTRDHLIGKAFVIYWPISQIGLL
ncbi:MAG: Signal peptidase [Firmicutes bacterium]|nr:Signal peptidase [Bacillota bacterium]